jgi:8-oxo-dGTP pyrophosphatase MutT (NUDIX family)
MEATLPVNVQRSRPRDAASLLIYRQQQGELQVLMGRRSTRARFLPDVYVFPGGALETADRLAARADGHRATALARAAVREAHEETGLQLLTDLRQLRYLGRAITPVGSRVRFHARFFALPQTCFSGVLGGDGELQDLRWVATSNPAGLALVDVTQFMLAELAHTLATASERSPLLYYVHGDMRVRMLAPFR